MSVTKRSTIMQLSADKALGVVGGGLAVASLGFGVYMNLHGPAASFGHSQDFTVFAQLTGHHSRQTSEQPAATPAPNDQFDMTATASIPKPSRGTTASVDDTDETPVISSVTLEAASVDAATVFVNGHPRTVRVGDIVPNAGEVVEIRLGARPTVKTTRGFILSSRQE